MKRLRGCLVIVAVLLILYMLSAFGGKSNQDVLPTLAVLEITTQTSRPDVRPTAASGFVTMTPAPGTVYPTATITDTPLSQVTIIPTITQTPGIQLTPIDLQIYYTKSTVNLRSCPNTACAVVEKVGAGLPLAVSGIAVGEEVDAGNPNWYKIEHSTSEEYGYSKLFTYNPPDQPPTQSPRVVIPTVQPVQPSVLHPDNCSTAVAMGLSPAQAAAEGLDRDGDHEACYGN